MTNSEQMSLLVRQKYLPSEQISLLPSWATTFTKQSVFWLNIYQITFFGRIIYFIHKFSQSSLPIG